jgi:predicted HTH domain antitoxin
MHETIPDDIVSYLQEHWGEDFPRRVLESLALEAYRERLIGEARLQRWLGLATRLEAHAFLKEHGVPLNYTLEDLEHDRQTYQRLGF